MNLGVGAIKDMRDAVTGVAFNAIYAIGGYSGKAILGTAEKYDIQNDMWTEIAPMKTPRRNVGELLIMGMCRRCYHNIKWNTFSFHSLIGFYMVL